MSDEEWAEFEASPQHQAWLAAKADADAQREAWLAWAHGRVDELSAEITAKVLAELNPTMVGFAPARGVVNVTRRHFDYSFDDVMVRTKMLDEYDLELAFDSPTVRVNRIGLGDLLPMTRLVAHFSALDRG